MTRPIVWALGVFGVAALSAGQFVSNGPPGAVAPASVAGTGERLLVIASDLRGHYIVHPTIGSARLRMLVDTGASFVALTAEDAGKAGIRPGPGDPVRTLSTANGVVVARAVRVREMSVGDIVVRDVEAVVMPPGSMGVSLLGMAFLRRLKGFEVSGGRLTLRG
ncbi:retropepsin-like aspartic protease family protein [Salinarimonas soli]|uniref:TIGR02281 family clan AA aspartic protease n=1 Tax=Salinarimonas soli TaxID=1638099 RepID=A0A5B2V9S3_9HYPH|nr:TIGR02281 family clan AA aspartic protease [Salinarimonas soli]KAA2234987.1 TIGR02281 family clan AA aspartic protease [Salinarimonas soli]